MTDPIRVALRAVRRAEAALLKADANRRTPHQRRQAAAARRSLAAADAALDSYRSPPRPMFWPVDLAW